MKLVVDASALVAMAFDEPEAPALYNALLAAGGGLISPVNLWEAAVRVSGAKSASGHSELEVLRSQLRIQVAPVTEQHTWAAVSAAARYGRRTPARLNLGDCFAYALATAEDLPLLFKGDDFTRTDVRSAL